MPAVPSADYQEAFVQFVPAGADSTYTILFDAVTSEDWPEQGASVTEHPVEKDASNNGKNVADHVRVKLVTCTLKVRVSNEPLDSNTFVDPIGGAGATTALALSLPVPDVDGFSGVLTVPTWRSNLDVAVQLGIIAGIASEGAAAAGDALANATPIGNLVARALRPTVSVTQTGNNVQNFADVPQAEIGGFPARSVGDAAGALVFDGIAGLTPPGEEVDVEIATTAGMPRQTGVPLQVTAQTVQFAGAIDFARLMMELLISLKNVAQLFTVYGSKQTQASMVIETLSSHRGATDETGTGIDITIGFKEVRIVTTNTVAAPLPTVPRAQTPINRGAQDPTDADPGTIKSVWLKGAEGLLNLLGLTSPPGSGTAP